MSTLWALSLVVVGILALLLPLSAGIGVMAIISWLILIGGIVHLFHSFSERRGGALALHVAIGAVYVLAGIYMLLHPLASLATLTLVIGTLLFVEGILRLVAYARLRRQHGAAWLLADGILTLILGAFIAATWPLSALWVPGTVLGISLIFSGISRLLHVRSGPPWIGHGHGHGPHGPSPLPT